MPDPRYTMPLRDYYIREDNGVPVLKDGTRVAHLTEPYRIKQYELLKENTRRCQEQRHLSRIRYRSTATGHVRIT